MADSGVLAYDRFWLDVINAPSSILTLCDIRLNGRRSRVRANLEGFANRLALAVVEALVPPVLKRPNPLAVRAPCNGGATVTRKLKLGVEAR